MAIQKTSELVVYLTKDKQHLTDHEGNIISRRVHEDGKTFYASIGIESEAYQKKCISLKVKKVCTLWNANHDCLVWDEVDVCAQWEYLPGGFNNIS